jgi:putative membrane protein insertion efficiency factor
VKLIWFVFLLPRNALVGFVLIWRKLISPLYGDVCRYYPSCSSYGLSSLQNHGVIRGVPLTIWRILRCHPWAAGGIDDVKTGPSWIVIGKLGFVSSKSQKKKR